MIDLRSLSRQEVTQLLTTELGEPAYRARQVFRWVHRAGATSFAEMTNLSKPLRARMEEIATLAPLRVDGVQRSLDGTRKLRLRTTDDKAIESVLIPDGEKLTQCISSQVGCALDCSFCATATLGLVRNLTTGEIVDQVYRARSLVTEDPAPAPRITNLVFMGMGEPLHNFDAVTAALTILGDEDGASISHRRITLSTAGLVPGIEKLGRSQASPNLAVSLNASDDETRDQLMPINRKWPLARLIAAIRAYPLERRRRVTFEYVLLAGVTDRPEDARRLGSLLHGLRCKLNIIPYNPHPASPFERPSDSEVQRFWEQLRAAGLPAYVRRPRGDDIDAACGQLANRE